MAKMGRPRKQIDKTEFEKLCFLQCTKQEFCSWFDTTDKTLERWCKETYGMGFSEVFRIKRENGIISLRRTQFQLAEKSPAMAIFLGKNLLGQTDGDRHRAAYQAKMAELREREIKIKEDGW